MTKLAMRVGVAAALMVGAGQAGAQEKPAEPSAAVPDYSSFILTPKPPDTPRINGARIFGVRPNHPFLFTIPVTGQRPLKFGALNLPPGLAVDASTGRITGTLAEPGTHVVTLTAENARGKAERELRILVGERLALTPPLGWNSWNAGGPFVDLAKVRDAATAMADKGLVQHGWTYINIDDAWQGKRGGKYNAIQPNEKFPDFKALADEVHGLGLKIGIYSTPWVTSYANYVGGSADNPAGSWNGEVDKGRVGRRHGKHPFAWADARQWAEWGFDYLKYDWNPNDVEHVRQMSDALRHSGRSSPPTSNSPTSACGACWPRRCSSAATWPSWTTSP